MTRALPSAHAPLADFALLALTLAYGADADLHPHETDAVGAQVGALAAALGMPPLSGADHARVIAAAAETFARVRVTGCAAAADRLAATLPAGALRGAFRGLEAVARADSRTSTMEQALLRNIARRWAQAA